MNTTQIFKNAAVNGVISEEKAVRLAKTIEQERDATRELLRECEKNVGMMLGERINAHLADMNGTYFNERDYHHERLPGEQ